MAMNTWAVAFSGGTKRGIERGGNKGGTERGGTKGGTERGGTKGGTEIARDTYAGPGIT